MEGEAWAEYRRVVERAIADRESAGTIPPGLIHYWQGHEPRFRMQVEMLERYLGHEVIHTVSDYGTEFPFATLYLNVYREAWIHFAGLGDGRDVSPFVRFSRVNLCRPPGGDPQADLVWCSECLEHLPCDIPRTMRWLASRARRWLFLSFPLGGARAGDYERDEPEKYASEHVREYTAETADALVAGLGWPVVGMRDSGQPAYGAPIRNVLLRRP